MTSAHTETGVWVRRFHQTPEAPVRLVCFPHAGGAASFYFPVSRTLSPKLDVLAIQYPGRQDRRHEPAVEDVGTLADLIVAELRPLMDKPLAFFGHSMGAVVAFEVTRRMASEGRAPVILFASGRRAPSAVREEYVHKDTDEKIIAELQRLSGTDARMLDDEEVLRMILPSLRSDYKAVETYRAEPGATVSCPIDVLIGDDDPHVTHAEATRWREHTTGPYDIEVFKGGHFYLNDHAPAVMNRLVTRISALHATD
ncbi:MULTISPECIES: thioesterase II family protein [unclassified Streptomyces]|uniref:thioesterase II family protein n=1 Tax=unclassified Streptomyces TaxID=2593676 RepID=UPI0036E947B6